MNYEEMGCYLPNPIVMQRADPYVIRERGKYYFTASYPLYDRIILRSARTLSGLQGAPEHVIWSSHQSGAMSSLIWAPELHRVAGRWIVYFAAAPDPDIDQRSLTFKHRIYALVCEDDDPVSGTWEEAGQVDTGIDSFCLDATSFVVDKQQYLVWAQKDIGIAGNSNLYIAAMRNPWTLDSPPAMISRPEYEWECVRFAVNEGPSVLRHGDRIFITYSASGTGPEYSMGLLSALDGSDLLDVASWIKGPHPVFTSEEKVRQFGPGHNSFTKAADGEQDLMVYHCRNYAEIQGDPLFDPNRHARIGIVEWTNDGWPKFGKPLMDTRWTPVTTDVLPSDGVLPICHGI